MPASIGIGFSSNLDAITAAEEAVAEAKQNLKAKRYDLAIVYNTVHYDPKEFLPVIFDSLDQTRLVGSSTAAIILPDRIEDKGIAVMALNSETIRFDVKYATHLGLQEMRSAGKNLAKKCMTEFGLSYRKIFLLFIDGLSLHIPAFIDGLHDELGKVFPILGAGSSDNSRFEKTYQYFQGEANYDSAVGVMLGGTFQMGLSARHGWKPLGKPRIVTETDGLNIKTIDDLPASELYKEYLADEAQGLNQHRLSFINTRYPLGFPLGEGNEYLLRNTLRTLDDGNIVCQDNITKGSEVHIMIGSKESCLLAAEEAAQEVKMQIAGRTPHLILIFESLMRYKLLGRSVKEEMRIIKNILGANVPVFGMLSTNEVVTLNYHSEQRIQTLLQNGNLVIAAIC